MAGVKWLSLGVLVFVMTEPKRIGIIGGMSPESTIEYYRFITQGYNEMFGGWNFPQVTIQSLNLQEVADAQDNNDWDRVAEIIVDGIYRLKGAGADFAAIASNTPHNAYDKIRELSPLYVLSIMDAVASEIKADGFSRVGLLGTKQTMEFGYFQKTFGEYGIDVVVPDEADRDFVDRVIWDELVHGKITEEARQGYVSVIRKMADEGVEAVVLGCTEIPLLIRQEDSPVKVYDTLRIHAQAILDYAIL